jgi:predicted anti-sigma-YlaC factor YlaD
MQPSRHEQIRALLSAYLDEELTQADSQRVRIHLEDCPECRQHLHELGRLKSLTGRLAFPDPPEEKMKELERRLSVRLSRGLGWILVCGGAAAWLVYALVMAILHWRTPTVKEMLGGAVLVGLLMLFFSVLRERLLELPHDRYRSVKK